MPDGIDVKFYSDDGSSCCVFSVEPGLNPVADPLAKKYSDYLRMQDTRFECNVIKTRFGDTVEVIALNWVSTRDFPYDPPKIDATEEKLNSIGRTIGAGWIFWKDDAQCGLKMIIPIDRDMSAEDAIQLSKQRLKTTLEGVEFQTTITKTDS